MTRQIGLAALLFVVSSALVPVSRNTNSQPKALDCMELPACPAGLARWLQKAGNRAVLTESGIAYILARDMPRSTRAYMLTGIAQRRFAQYFGMPKSRGLIYQDSINAMPNAWRVDWVLPWNPTSRTLDSPAGKPDLLVHEIGHRLFAAEIWPDNDKKEPEYGTPAPDWLDEAAALLMETPVATARRRARLYALARSEGLLPLEKFFAATHPSLTHPTIAEAIADARHRIATTGTDPVTVRVTLRVPPSVRQDPSAFYAQTRGFVDFLLEATGEDRIFLEIAEHLKAGGDMESWLAESATARAAGLGPDIGGIERQWRRWVAKQGLQDRGG